MTTNERTIRRFLALPATALPQAVVRDNSGDFDASAWSLLQCALEGDCQGVDVRLRADRDGWRDGVIVTA